MTIIVADTTCDLPHLAEVIEVECPRSAKAHLCVVQVEAQA
jgi:hypothetical protein